jgi:hypothetical protein
MAHRLYSRFDGDRPYTDLDLEKMSTDEQVNSAVNWLLQNFQRPSSRVFQDTLHDEGWQSDRFLNARTILFDQFGDFLPDNVIELALAEVEEVGREWLPKQEEDQVEVLKGTLERKLKADLVSQLGDLRDQLIETLPHAGLGHNNPPEHIRDRPIDFEETRKAVRSVEAFIVELKQPEPNADKARSALQYLTDLSGRVANWLGARATVGVDAAIKGAATAAGASAVVAWGNVRGFIGSILELAAQLF